MNPGIPIPSDAEIGDQPASAGQPSAATSSSSPVPIPDDAYVGDDEPTEAGYYMNDVGNRVIVPKDGESFDDTVKRAIAYHKTLSPQKQQEAMQREVATMPKKVAAVAAAIPAVAALPIAGNEAIEGVGAALDWLTNAPVGMETPLEKALPIIKKFGGFLMKNGIGFGVTSAILKEIFDGEKKK